MMSASSAAGQSPNKDFAIIVGCVSLAVIFEYRPTGFSIGMAIIDAHSHDAAPMMLAQAAMRAF